MKKSQINAYLHMPDLLFVRFCEKEFKVNRGIYNTIEQWFYDQGFHNILQRRETILGFLQFINMHQNNTGKIKFGYGGLTEQLNNFLYQYKAAQ